MSKITAIVDLQFGSTGKGLIAGYLSQKKDFDLVVSANMPNAGHTFVDSNGKAWVNKVLPSGVYSKSLKYICLGPGAIFNPIQLQKEVLELRERDINAHIIIHPAAALVNGEHREAEQNGLSHIASTMQGSMEAMIHKMRRDGLDTNIASDPRNKAVIAGAGAVVSYEEWMGITNAAQNILMEGSQGYSLGINAGFYPYCTSRDCTVWRLLADCGLTVTESMRVIGSARLHPIRVGNTPDGYSGKCYPDQTETTWEKLGVPAEYTTVTKRERRVFTFSETQVQAAIIANRVDDVFLNFCNYNTREAFRVMNIINSWKQRVQVMRGTPDWLMATAPLVRYMGFGPQAEDIIDMNFEPEPVLEDAPPPTCGAPYGH